MNFKSHLMSPLKFLLVLGIMLNTKVEHGSKLELLKI